MKFAEGQIVKWIGKRVEIIRAHWPRSGHQIYSIRVLEDTLPHKAGDTTSVYEFMLHPISPLEQLARTCN